MEAVQTLPPLALYVHLPWCVRKCPYCDFNSHGLRGEIPDQAYVDALLRDLRLAVDGLEPRPLVSVFLGGGTPSLFGAPALARLLEGVAALLPLPATAEITVEANPGTAEAARFRAYRAAGINRISLGVQSLRDAMLATLGRIHTAAQAQQACALARSAGFDDVNVDLMYALPGDTPAGSHADLERIVALGPGQISWYQLTIEPGTAFHRAPPALPDEDTVAAIETGGHALLAAAGYTRYEVSAYARAGRRCRHNLNYWEFGDYLGIGAGAHGKFTRADGTVVRSVRVREPGRYMAEAGSAAGVRIEIADAPGRRVAEFLLNALRLVDGFEVTLFEQRTGLPRALLDAALAEARVRGWIEVHGGRIRPSAAGFPFLNDILVSAETALDALAA
ncbi:MAG: radical SAM family heme chaperone HemW [Gammaproteobacteria bacterium]|nr:radical SAM family heme chaperone HemW [Gammaproteobacteria bacterium]